LQLAVPGTSGKGILAGVGGGGVPEHPVLLGEGSAGPPPLVPFPEVPVPCRATKMIARQGKMSFPVAFREGLKGSVSSNRVTPTLGAVANISDDSAPTPFPFFAKRRGVWHL